LKNPSNVSPAVFVEAWENPPADKLSLVKSLVGHSVIVRKSEQSLNFESVMIVLAFFGMFGWFFYALNAKVNRIQQHDAIVATRISMGGNAYDIGGLANLKVEITPALVVPTVTSTPSPIPSPSVLPSITPSFPMVRENVLMKLSFYDPQIGMYYPDIASVNCANWSVEQNTCLSLMADGTPFAPNYGRAVACPPPMQNGDILEVSYPVQLQGEWTCRDRGWAIENGYLDFLLRYPDMIWTGHDLNLFPWSSTVRAVWVHP